MALATGTLFAIQDTATTGNTGGAGFNPGNANFPTDATTDANTANTASPVLSSATYNFVAGDVGAWIYIKSGTNWTPGFYKIASVASNKATLNAAIGAAVQLNASTNMYEPNTVVGCATVGTPTNGTYGVDYSQSDAAITTATDFTAVGASTTLTSATAAFRVSMVGNFFHQTTTGTGAHGLANWFEIVSYTNATTVVLDRTPNDGTTSVACTGFVGGAGRLNGLEDAFYEMIPASSTVYLKSGSYTTSAAISITSTNSTAILASLTLGFTSIRGDSCNGSNRPVITAGANAMVFGQSQSFKNIIMTGTAAATITLGLNTYITNCKITNSSTVGGRIAISVPASSCTVYNCEIIALNGTGISGTAPRVMGCYIHDCNVGTNNGGASTYAFNIFEACGTGMTSASVTGAIAIINNTFYGSEAKSGTGLNLSTANSGNAFVGGNIFYGLTTGISVNTGPALSNLSRFNIFFNNTSDISNWYKSVGDATQNPNFVGASQITGTTATTSGSTLTQSGGAFSGVTDNVDYLHVISGTGVTVANYLITGHTSTTLTTNNALGTSSAGDVVYFITNGHNFAIGSAARAQAFPGTFPASLTTGYLDNGAAQRAESVGYTFS